MQIRKIKIVRYKSIKDPVVIDDFSNFHILVGPNNAGKTNILDAINLFFDPSPDEERFGYKDADIEITLKVGKENINMRYKGSRLEKELGARMRNRFIRIKDTSSIYHLIPKELESFKKNCPEEYGRFSSSLEDYFRDIEISEELFVLNVLSEKKERPIRRMGEGFKRLFVILFYIFHPQYDIILIDEPEMHLHPSVIKRFLFMLKDEKLNNQIFLTTHHPALVQVDHFKNIWRVNRNERGSTAVYTFPRKNFEHDRFIQEINDDNSGMLFSDKVLLVEGVSDYIFMRELLRRFYKREKDIKVVYTGGKGTIDLYAEICDLFKIPYAVMLDRDALDSIPLQRIPKYPSFKKEVPDGEKMSVLKKQEIFILEKTLESAYPKHYKRKETKPLSALSISRRITEKELEGKSMRIIKEVLDRI